MKSWLLRILEEKGKYLIKLGLVVAEGINIPEKKSFFCTHNPKYENKTHTTRTIIQWNIESH